MLFNQSLRVKNCCFLLVDYDQSIWSYRPRSYCLLDLVVVLFLNCCSILDLLFHFIFVVPFQSCCYISWLLPYFSFVVSFLANCYFGVKKRSQAVVSIYIYCLAPKSTICSPIYLSSISLQRDELLLLNPWLINCLAFWMCGWIF